MSNELRIISAAVSDRGLSEKRPQNEDSYLEMPASGIFAVADGVGGAQAGEVASQMAMEIIGEAFANSSPANDAEEVMRAAIERANSAIYQMAQELPQLANMASTVVALHLGGDIATIAHVGDSRVYSVDRGGELSRQTDDHSVVAEEVRAGRMTEEQAENHPSKNVISRALGAEPTVDIDIRTVMVEPGTSFLLCSDGITRHVGDAEIKGVLTFGGDPVDVCEYLRGLCYERGAEDNLTAVVVKTASMNGAADSPEPQSVADSDDDEPTIATARSPWDEKALDDDDELLELNTGEFKKPSFEEPVAHPPASEEVEQEYADEAQPVEDAAFSGNDTPFTMFGGTAEESDVEEAAPRASSGGKVLTAVVCLLLGAGLGLAAYHFGIAPRLADPAPTQPLTEMRAANIPLSAFEENRRSVDKDPAGYIQKFPAPQDAEDYYLVGRAYLMTGDYVKARAAFVSAREKLNEADPTNLDVLRDDIAIMMAVTNDTTIQTILKKEFQPTASPAANSNTNTNANR